jgi:hypothetical protein
MNVADSTTVASPVPGWRKVAKLAAIWMFGCSFTGLAMALIGGDFWSTRFIGSGALVGLSGAVVHSFLIRRKGFRRLSVPAKGTALWAGAMVIPIAEKIYTAHQHCIADGFFYVMTMGVAGFAVFTFVASACITLYEAHRPV